MKYAFLTTLIPKQFEEEIRLYSRRNMQDAANALQWNIYEGLCLNLGEEIKIMNVLPIGSFPQYYKRCCVKESTFETPFCKRNKNIGFCNIKLLRKFIQPMNVYRELKKWCMENDEQKTLFVYTVSAAFMSAITKIKQKCPDIKVCAVIADLPDMSSLKIRKSIFQKMFERYLANNSYTKLECVDVFVLLTKHMADYIGISKPFAVMEGIAASGMAVEPNYENEKKVIMYTGTLHKRFGILNLLSAFNAIKNPDYRLIVCGLGDSEDEVEKFAENDARIEFKGQLTREEVLKLQNQATVLVNPRQNNEEFTKYSFPSKTMEYLASGVPVVAYKLDGIPDEYDEYIKYVQDDSVQSLAIALQEICELSADERRKIGKKARDFVLNKKNAVVQTKKMIELVTG